MINTIFYFPDSDAAYKKKVAEQQISTHTISLVPNDDNQTGRIYKNNILYSDGKLNPETVSQTILNGDTIYNDFYESKLYNVIDEMLTSRMHRLEKWVDDVLNRIKNGATEDVIVMGEPLSVERDGKRYPKVWVYKNDEEKEITEDLIKKNYSNVPKGAYCKRKDMILKFVEGILQSIEETDEITYPFTTAGNSNTAVVVGPDGEPVDLDNIQPGDSGTIKDDDGDDERWIIGAMSTNPDLVKVTVEGDEPNKVVHWEVINNPDEDTRVSIIIFYNIAPDEIISMTVKHVAAKSITVNTTLEYMRVNKQSNEGDFTYSIVWPEGAATELLNNNVKVKWDSNPQDRVTSQIPVKVTPNQEGNIEVIAKILVDNISGSITLPVKSGTPTVIDDKNGTITTGDWDIESVAFETITPPVEIEGVVKQDSEWFYAGKKAGKENEVEYYVKGTYPDKSESVKITITFKDGGSKDVIVDVEGTGWVNVPGTITPSNPELNGDGDNEGTIDAPTGLTIKSFDVSYNPSTVLVEGEDKTNEFFEVKKVSDTRLNYKALLQPDNDVTVTITIHYNESDKTSVVTITVKGTGWPESAIDRIFANVNIDGPESIIKGETADYSIDLGQYANRMTVVWSTISGNEDSLAVHNEDVYGTFARGTFEGVNESTTDGVKAVLTMGSSSITKTKNVQVIDNTPKYAQMTAPKAATGLVYSGEDKELISERGTATNGTDMYIVTTENAQPTNTTGFSHDIPTAKGNENNDTTYYVWYFADAAEGYNDSQIGGPVQVTILKKPITIIELTESNTTVTINPTESVYTGKEIKPAVTVTYNDAALTTNDYDVSYSNNKNVGTATATVTGKGTYTGTITKTFTITKKSLTVRADNKSVTRGESAPTYTVTYDGFVEGESAATYNFEPSISCEYTPESTGSSYVIEVTGGQLDNYNCKYANGTLTVSEIPTATVTTAPRANQLTYTGGPQGLVTGGTASNGTMQYAVSNTRPDISAFTETIPAGKDAGTYTVWFYAKGNDGYNNSAINSVQVAIHPKTASISYATSNVEKTVGDAAFTNPLSNDGGASVTYSSSTPGVATVNETTGEVTIVSAGTTQITATAAENANYEYTTSTASYTLVVKSNVINITDNANITIDDIPAQTYTGSAITPMVVVKNNGTAMVKDTDYTVTYSDNTNAGTAKVTITGKGGYTGSKEKNFTINKANITPVVTMESWNVGETPKEPSVTGNPGNGTVTYEYKLRGAGDNTYTATKPSTEGNYVVKATVEETDNYFGGVATKEFAIIDTTVQVTGVTLDKTGVDLIVGENTMILATVLPPNATNTEVTWISNKPNIVTVTPESGNVGNVKAATIAAVAEGEAEIVAMTANASIFAKCIVSVTTPTVTKVTISGDTVVDVDSTIQLNAAVTMSDGSTYNGTIAWASSDTTKATVDSTGKVTGVAGAVSVKITATAGGVTGEYTIGVTEKMTQMGSISYATTSINKTVGDEAFTNPLTNTGDGTVTYSSSDSNIAQVNSTTGLVTIGTTAGSATITATVADSENYTYNVKTASYTVNVAQSEDGRQEGETQTITLHFTTDKGDDDTAVYAALWKNGYVDKGTFDEDMYMDARDTVSAYNDINVYLKDGEGVSVMMSVKQRGYDMIAHNDPNADENGFGYYNITPEEIAASSDKKFTITLKQDDTYVTPETLYLTKWDGNVISDSVVMAGGPAEFIVDARGGLGTGNGHVVISNVDNPDVATVTGRNENEVWVTGYTSGTVTFTVTKDLVDGWLVSKEFTINVATQ